MTETAERHLAGDGDSPDITPGIVAEQAVLGTALLSADGAAAALAVLAPEHFSRTVHRLVFEAVERLADAGVTIKASEWPSAVMGELARAGMLAKAGAPGMGSGAAYLHSLMERAGSVAYHAPVVLAAARQRGIVAALRSAEFIATGRGFDADVHLEQIRALIEDASGYAEPAVLRPNSEAVLEVLEAIEKGADPGLPTGFPDLDEALGGLRPGELIVIAARPGVGKTVSGLCIADHVGTRLGLPVLFSSLEMTEPELTARRISATARVPLYRLVRGELTSGEWDQIARVHGKLTGTRLFIDDTSGASLGHIRGRLRAMERTGEAARLLVIDYLGFMQAPKAESRQQAVASLARGVKLLAREFSIPVILLAQLNRGPEHRSDKMPAMADLRESGEIEQSADIVILLHREDAYEPDSPRAGETDLIVAKNRQGPHCTVTLAFQGHYARLVSMSSAWTPSAAAGDA